MSYNKIHLLTIGGSHTTYSSLQEAINAGNIGDCVVLYPGTYTGSITLKNGVDIECIGPVTLSGTSAEGTLKDTAVTPVDVAIKGTPTIINSNGFDSAIVLNNSGSVIRDFYWEYTGILYGLDETTASLVTLRNTFGDNFTAYVGGIVSTQYRVSASIINLNSYVDKAVVDFTTYENGPFTPSIFYSQAMQDETELFIAIDQQRADLTPSSASIAIPTGSVFTFRRYPHSFRSVLPFGPSDYDYIIFYTSDGEAFYTADGELFYVIK